MTRCPIPSRLSLSLSSQTLNELPPIGSRRLRTLTIALKKARRGGGEEGRGQKRRLNDRRVTIYRRFHGKVFGTICV